MRLNGKRRTVLIGAAVLAALTSAVPADAVTDGPAAYAPYLYNGWGDPPDPGTVMSATGTTTFTLAFVLSNGTCDPQWDGSRPLDGGVDAQTIDAIRGAGGDVVPSFGGYSGNKLEQACADAGALAGAYQKVIDAYGLHAIDIDIEADAYTDPTVQQRTIDALKTVRDANPGIKLYVTFPTDQSGPSPDMIDRAADSGLEVDAWTIMPFDFGGGDANMGELTKQATDGLAGIVRDAYGYDDAAAYAHSGISSMNGITDMQETVTQDDFRAILSYAQEHHLGRLAYWSVNRDRPCDGGAADSCSGVDQSDWEYTSILAGYTG